jgi:hypothetical protein
MENANLAIPPDRLFVPPLVMAKSEPEDIVVVIDPDRAVHAPGTQGAPALINGELPHITYIL